MVATPISLTLEFRKRFDGKLLVDRVQLFICVTPDEILTQIGCNDPAYAAHVAIHGRAWLKYRSRLPARRCRSNVANVTR